MASKLNSEIPYLDLDGKVEQAILDDKAKGRLNPHRFEDKDIIRREDLPHDRATLARPAFTRDVEKIINVPAYNRYTGKTQVFSFVNNDDITRRGLHVQLVCRVARGIGRLLGLNLDLIEAIALGHDVGHTPFGHAGERFLTKYYHEKTGRYFNHNVQSVRVLDRLYPRNISLQTLDGILCHNGEFAKQRLACSDIGSFDKFDDLVEECTSNESRIATLRPSTLEGCVVRVSDMIAYVGKDRDDALNMGVIDSYDVFDSSIMGKDNSRIINNLTIDIVNNSYGKDCIQMSEEMYHDLKGAKQQNYEVIYMNEGILDDASNVVDEMFEQMYDKILYDLLSGDENSTVWKHHIAKLASTSRTIDPYKYATDDPHQVVVDYIASMTDEYFMNLYRRLFPGPEKEIRLRGYSLV